MTSYSPLRIIFLCTGNSIRSQMAEALMRHYGGERVEVYSAGVSPSGIHPFTWVVMEEENLSLLNHRSKSLDEVPLKKADFIITLCGYAKDVCPPLPSGIRHEHWPIPDPVSAPGTDEERLHCFRKTRDEIKQRIQDWIARFF